MVHERACHLWSEARDSVMRSASGKCEGTELTNGRINSRKHFHRWWLFRQERARTNPCHLRIRMRIQILLCPRHRVSLSLHDRCVIHHVDVHLATLPTLTQPELS